MASAQPNAQPVQITARAFSSGRKQKVRCIVDDDGTVRVFDHVAGYYTTCHALSARNQARVRRLAGG